MAAFGSRKGVFKNAKAQADARGPKTARTIILTIFGFLAAGLWVGATTNVPEVTRASGELVPQGGYRQVQSIEGGQVLHVHVTEGDLVDKGAPLAVLVSTELSDTATGVAEDLRSAEAELANLQALAATLRARGAADAGDVTSLADRGFAFAADQLSIIVAEHRAQRAIAEDLDTMLVLQRDAHALALKRLGSQQEQIARQEELLAKGLVPRSEYDARRDAVDRLEATTFDLAIRITQTQRDLTTAHATLERDVLKRLTVLTADIFHLEQRAEALRVQADTLNARRAALTVRAPETGYIHEVAYPNSGEVIAPGETIFELLPVRTNLIAEIEFDPIDIGHIGAGDRVTLKMDTYDVRRYGHVGGTIHSISPNSITDPKTSKEFFRAKVVLDSDTIGLGRWTQRLRAGMVTTAEIVTAERTAIAYLAKPISRSLENAFSER